MPEVLESGKSLPAPPADAPRCLNCGDRLHGVFCSRCGQHALDYHRRFGQLIGDIVGDVFSLDTRLIRTLRPLLLAPGHVTREYLAGRRVAYVPALRSYLIAALIFFGLFTIFPTRTPVFVFTEGTPQAEAARGGGGSRVSFALPARVPIFDEGFQAASARAQARPEAFASAVWANVPRAFFLFLPIFALLLELFYRKQGYYIDHLVFSLYYHAFVFLGCSLLFIVLRSRGWIPAVIAIPAAAALVVWLLAYLPLALRRVYGGSWAKTFLKLVGLGALYSAVFVLLGIPFVLAAALFTV